MFDEKKLLGLRKMFQRIFSLPITRSTFREVQNAVLTTAEGKQEDAKEFIEQLLGRDGDLKKNGEFQLIEEKFAVPVWVAKDVHDRGEFLNLITSDIISQTNRVLFSNRVRRIDGEELHFISDMESTIQVLQHFVNRIAEASKIDESKAILDNFKKELSLLKNSIEHLVKK